MGRVRGAGKWLGVPSLCRLIELRGENMDVVCSMFALGEGALGTLVLMFFNGTALLGGLTVTLGVVCFCTTRVF
eukprot:12675298-Ditylum_brightwellii.AAC.1